MSTPTLTRAAELLECEAAILRESCTDADGEWSDKCELLRTAHDERLRVAADLRAMTAAAPQPPAIGEPWPGIDGTYAGIARGEDGQPDGHLILLDARLERKQSHAGAKTWAEGLGDGARLPTRFESALLYAHLREHIDPRYWYWTHTLTSDGSAWCQDFGDGYQGTNDTDYEGRVVAVIRIPVSAAQPADVARLVEALDWIDDFIARCNGDDRGACEAVNRVRAALAGKGADHA